MRFITSILVLLLTVAVVADKRLDAPGRDAGLSDDEYNILAAEQAISSQVTALYVYHKMYFTPFGSRKDQQIVLWYGFMVEVRAFKLVNDLKPHQAMRIRNKSQLLAAFTRYLSQVGSATRLLPVEHINTEYQRISKQVLDSP